MQIPDLRALRAWPRSWAMLGFELGHDADGERRDINRIPRYRALAALQYHFETGDEALLRYLFIEETAAHEALPEDGLSDALVLGACLLARLLDPTDLPVLARARAASFDTEMGLPLSCLHVVRNTAQGARWTQEHAALVSSWETRWPQLVTAADDLDREWAHLQRKFPTRASLERPVDLANRHLAFGEPDVAVDILQTCLTAAEDSEVRTRLVTALRAAGRYTEAAIQVAQQLPRCTGERELAGKLAELIGLYVLAEAPARAGRAIRRLDGLFGESRGLRTSGVVRHAARYAWETVSAHPDEQTARELYAIVNAWFEDLSGLPIADLETAFNAARRCGYHDDAERYAHWAADQQAAIDAFLAD
ncbi:MAG: hypothetical protein AAF458_17035 [Pseudomonadota bacterium]